MKSYATAFVYHPPYKSKELLTYDLFLAASHAQMGIKQKTKNV